MPPTRSTLRIGPNAMTAGSANALDITALAWIITTGIGR